MNFSEILHNTMSVQSKSHDTSRMQKYLVRFARRNGIEVHNDGGNIYMTKGETDFYPCIVAHTDTVHSVIEDFIVVPEEGNLFGWDRKKKKQVGCGGDDKVGIALALWFMYTYPACKAAFFRDEEVGCMGSAVADLTFFDDVSFVIQADRRGDRDMVNRVYSETLFNEEFEEAASDIIKRYGRKTTTGALTDVYKLRSKGMKVASMNLSCGYYLPHTDKEYVIIEDVIDTRDFMHDLFQELGDRQWEFPKSYVSTYTYSGRNYVGSKWKSNYGLPILDSGEEETEEPEPDDEGGEDDFYIDVASYCRANAEIHYVGDDFFKDPERCPLCSDRSVNYDDSTDLWYCDNCMSFVKSLATVD